MAEFALKPTDKSVIALQRAYCEHKEKSKLDVAMKLYVGKYRGAKLAVCVEQFLALVHGVYGDQASNQAVFDMKPEFASLMGAILTSNPQGLLALKDTYDQEFASLMRKVSDMPLSQISPSQIADMDIAELMKSMSLGPSQAEKIKMISSSAVWNLMSQNLIGCVWAQFVRN